MDTLYYCYLALQTFIASSEHQSTESDGIGVVRAQLRRPSYIL